MLSHPPDAVAAYVETGYSEILIVLSLLHVTEYRTPPTKKGIHVDAQENDRHAEDWKDLLEGASFKWSKRRRGVQRNWWILKRQTDAERDRDRDRERQRQRDTEGQREKERKWERQNRGLLLDDAYNLTCLYCIIWLNNYDPERTNYWNSKKDMETLLFLINAYTSFQLL